MSQKLVIFDCDGTLVDGQHLIIDSMRVASERCDITFPGDDVVRRIVGLSLDYAIAQIYPTCSPEQHEQIQVQFIDYYRHLRATEQDHEPLYDGILEMIHHLHDEGYLLGVATGKSRRGLINTLKKFDVLERFITLNTADDGPGKPHPSMIHNALLDSGVEPEDAYMIGDTSFDMEMARAANVTAIGVSWGYHAPQELIRAGAHHMIDHISSLPDILRT